MKTTVILCTYNRSESLTKTLASAARLKLPESVDWEVLVVDNNSNDQTREVTEDFCRQYPEHFRYLFEPRQGKSYALNRGIGEARGDIIAFIDDDVTFEPTWLQNLTASLHHGQWAGAGGRILPQGALALPNWVPLEDRYSLAPLGIFNPSLPAGPLAEPPFGTNMAFHRRVFERHGGFRVDLGPGDGLEHPQKSEDSEFGHRLISAGNALRYEPSAVVFHAVPSNRLTKKYFLDWWFDKARADIRAFGIPTDTRWLIAGIPLHKFRRLAVWTLRWVVALDPQHRFRAKIRVWVTVGEIKECYRLTREKRRQQDRRDIAT
jgi:glycosyltransferase involved in cell wall biosynthesis